MYNPLKNFLLKRNRKKLEFTLESCVPVGLLTREEFLRIKKDRAIAEWKSETIKDGLKRRKKKAKEVITEEFEEEE